MPPGDVFLYFQTVEPAGVDLNIEIKIIFFVGDGLEFAASGLAYFFYASRTNADDHRFVTSGRGENGGFDIDYTVLAFVDVFNLDMGGIWQFFTQTEEEFFTNEFAQPFFVALVGELEVWVMCFAFWQVVEDPALD